MAVEVALENLANYLMEDVIRFKKNLPDYINQYLQSREFDIRREFELGYNNSGLKVQGGQLIGSYTTKYFTFGNGAGVEITNTQNYASYMEDGTMPHMIRPKNAAALHFFSNGVEVFAKSVQHPGTRPYKFMEMGADLTMKMLENGIGDYLKRKF